jgi:hypothetical protein
MPTGVEEPVMMSAATGFRAFSTFGVVFLYTGATFLVRLHACLFVSHNLSFRWLSFSLAPTSLGVAADLWLCQFGFPEASATLRAANPVRAARRKWHDTGDEQ